MFPLASARFARLLPIIQKLKRATPLVHQHIRPFHGIHSLRSVPRSLQLQSVTSLSRPPPTRTTPSNITGIYSARSFFSNSNQGPSPLGLIARVLFQSAMAFVIANPLRSLMFAVVFVLALKFLSFIAVFLLFGGVLLAAAFWLRRAWNRFTAGAASSVSRQARQQSSQRQSAESMDSADVVYQFLKQNLNANSKSAFNSPIFGSMSESYQRAETDSLAAINRALSSLEHNSALVRAFGQGMSISRPLDVDLQVKDDGFTCRSQFMINGRKGTGQVEINAEVTRSEQRTVENITATVTLPSGSTMDIDFSRDIVDL